ncbi:hypothetical protein K7432_013838 [Basidiobolus ranarum]|uniref:Fungal lipase-type domain-containing protein n=1 Tax=Basidiobolus ranarum TaxID=34480 RepID=A0ABR2VQ91_9FUNG
MKWLIPICSLLALGSTVATPITKREALAVLEKSELDTLKTHAKYASAAYCPQAKLQNWTCGERCVGNLNVTSYFSEESSGLAGYLGYSQEEKKIVISFRGSANWANWVKNLAFVQNNFVYPTASDRVKVHSGFYESYTSVEKKIHLELKQILTTLKNETEPYKLVITGHSLGAAVAAFCAMDIKRFYLNPKSEKCYKKDLLIIDRSQIYLHTYGQPRTGNVDFSQLVYDTFGKNTTHATLARVTNKNDPVSRLPPQNLGYLHHPHEVYIRKDDTTVACNDVTNNKVNEDPNCINSIFFPVGFSAHSKFWGVTFGSGC